MLGICGIHRKRAIFPLMHIEHLVIVGEWSYSAFHKAAGSLVTGRSQKYWQQERPPPLRGCSPIEGFTDGTVKWWNSTRQSWEP